MVDSITNDTDFAVYADRTLTRDGERLLTVVKGTFLLAEGAATLLPAPAAAARPIRAIDIHWGDPLTTAPKYPCDLVPRKLATDVVVVADGHAPGGRPARQFDVSVRVGALSKTLRVFGIRAWQAGGAGLSRPQTLTRQEIRYDHAWGGVDLSDPAHPSGDMRNPVGRDWVTDADMLTDALAPCIEDPAEPIRSAATRPTPAGFGPIGPHWLPRSRFMGTYDEAWQRDRAPLPPADLDDRHYQCGSPKLVAEPWLSGGEPVGLVNLTAGGGELVFALPALGLVVEHDLGGSELDTHHPPIDTVLIDTLHVPAGARAVVELVWRTLTPWPEQPSDAIITVGRSDAAPEAQPAPSQTPPPSSSTPPLDA